MELKLQNGASKLVDLLHPERISRRSFETTVITGRNGSNKSTLLKQLVKRIARPPLGGELVTESLNPNHHQVLCISGSAADRFPQKSNPGGSRTAFDVPNYTYVGQRVGSNLLSKKAPLEAMLSFALDARKRERFSWEFFRDAHAYAGLRSESRYKVQLSPGWREMELDLIGAIQAKSRERGEVRNSKRSLPHVSPATAEWLLDEFDYDDFIELQNWGARKGVRLATVSLSERGAAVKNSEISKEALRLGLLTELVRLREVTVMPIEGEWFMPAEELSSGEYHMLSTMLAVGFALEPKAVLLMDEPENNLHPQWQRDLMSAIFDVCDKVRLDGHVIISTHSPLIVGSVPESSSVVDMSSEPTRLSLVSYGASSDELLLSQFGVGSSRNAIVVETIQRAISMVENGSYGGEDFMGLVPDLKKIRSALTDNDPLISVIDALIDDGE
ncbi:ATP-binding protein [Xanthomonas sp. CFBP 8445]|uniref:ATP-binding protein n=1 Tax=Xanthomonas sp. CFBP 8445 TaxID=2971236 RepID=UPI0021DF89ED|nr:ATP-binding protein [Xanthomonas sp. CFBP 8445]UYC11883.1 ATP-binding protein [Xanthomonas sp. CFBP 8445]